jgi:uracil-DNA glycosylase family 4
MLNRIVPPDGRPDAKIAFVGEAPGEIEIRTGKPFTGPAGEQLWTICRSCGIGRHDCYITNVVKERPPANDISKFITFSKNGAVETPAFIEYKKQLFMELDNTTCNIIVPLGAVAMYALTSLTGITKRRGSVYHIQIGSRMRKVMPTIHPSAILRQYGNKGGGNYLYSHYVRMDLRRAVRESASPEYKPTERSILVQPTFLEAITYLKGLKAAMEIGLDIEVVNEEVSCISLSWHNTSMSIPFVHNGSEYLSPEQEVEVWEHIGSIMEDPNIKKIGQNFIFDCGFLFRKYGIRPVNVDCTMIEMAILFPDFPRGLDFITTMYTDLQYYKDDGKKYFKIGGDERDFWTYNAKDSLVCSETYPKLQAELVRQGNLDAYRRQSKMIEPCVYMQERGMRMDVTGMKAASVDAEKKLSAFQEELNQLAGMELNPNSPKQLIEYFYIKKRIKPYIGKEGNMTTDEDAMRRLARQGIKEAQIIRDMRRWRKLKGTYLDVKLSSDGRLRSAMNPGKTKTGRLASGEDIFGEGTNVQNIPEGVRQYMLIDEGYVCYVCDLSQAENRIVANIAPEPIMLDIFASGKDMHSITGAYVSGLKAEFVKQQDNEGIKSPLGSGEYTWRFWGKKLNHCKLASCEVLTKIGWVNIATAFKHNMKIAQWDSGDISFVTPTDWTAETYSGDIHTIENQRIFQEATSKHRMPLIYSRKDRPGVKDKVIHKQICDYPSSGSYYAPLSGMYREGDTDLSATIIRFIVAFQADGSWNGNGIRIRVTKDRKVRRIQGILEASGMDYNNNPSGFEVSAKNEIVQLIKVLMGKDKEFGPWLLTLTSEKLKVFLDEVKKWDGHEDTYFTTNRNNAEWVQTIAHLCGKAANIGEQDNSRTDAYGNKTVYRVGIRDSISPASHAIRHTVRRVLNELVFCPSVPGGDFLCREHGIISVTGNSLNYDLGYKTFALRFDLIEAEAKPLVEGWHQLYAGIRQYHAWVQAQLQATSTLTNLFGRKRLFLNRPDDKRNKEAYAQIPQSTVADKIDGQGVEYIYYEEPELFYPVDLLNQIHDSVIFQLPLSIPWQHHADILIALKRSLESPLDWHGNTFIIPLDIKMHIHNLSKKDGKEVKIDGSDTGRLAAQLSEIYRQYGSTQQVSSVEWDISDISVLEEEGSDALGNGYSIS